MWMREGVRGGGGGMGARWGTQRQRREREREISDRTKSCQINFTDISNVILFPLLSPQYTPHSHSPQTWTYLRGGQTDSAHALRAWVQAGILGLVQSRVHGEMLLAVHGHHPPPCKHLANSVAPDMKAGKRTATELLCSPSPDWAVNTGSASRHPSLPLLPPPPPPLSASPSPHLLLCSTYKLKNVGLCAQASNNKQNQNHYNILYSSHLVLVVYRLLALRVVYNHSDVRSLYYHYS